MSISPQTIAPLSQQLVDPNTGFPTKPLADFLFHLANTAGYDDEALKTEIESILGTQAEHGGLITKLLDSLQDEANARKVALQVLQQQIVDDTLALTRKIDFYKSRLNDINASFTRIQQSQVSDREASAKMKQTFSAENKSRKAEIKTEMLARIDADSAIASDITQLQTDLGSVDGAVLGNSSAISALDARVTTNEGDISANASDITSLQSDLTDIGGDVSGNSSAISTLQTNVSQNISDIVSVQANASQALADAVSAQSTADAATSAAQLAQDTADGKITAFYQATAPSGGVESGDLWFDTNDGNKCHRWTGSSWSAIDDARIADAVSAAATAQSTADGKVVTFVQSSQPVAEGTGDLWFDSDDSYKEYRWSGSAWAEVADARISANASDITSLQSDLTDIGGDVSGNSSAISTLQTNVSDLDGVVDAMASDMTSLEAGIAAETSNRQNADDALSASITSEKTARVAADNDLAVDVAAVASDVTTLSSTVGSHTTSITTLSQSVDGIEGKWGVAIDSNDYITGVELIGSGQTSAFNINADVFSVNSPGSDDFSFQVADGKVKINGGLIVNGSLDTSQITDNAVTVRASASGTTLAQTATINFMETTDVIALCFGLWGTVSGSFRRLELYRDTTLLKTWYLPILSIFSGTSITPIHKFSVSPGDHSFKLTASASASECIIVIMGLKK